MTLNTGSGKKLWSRRGGYGFKLRSGQEFDTGYAMIGMAAVGGGEYPLYAEAANEKGLCIAGLYFPGSAVITDRILIN